MKLVDRASKEIVASLENDQGVKKTFFNWQANKSADRDSFYIKVLKDALHKMSQSSNVDMQGIPILLSGMASSSIGIRELPYAQLPASLNGENLIIENISSNLELQNEVFLISGLEKPGDVMRGEETQAIGWKYSSFDASSNCVLIVPGTHSKHITICDDRIVDFKTFMTGEIFELLTSHSILSDSVQRNTVWNSTAKKILFARSRGCLKRQSYPLALLHKSSQPAGQNRRYASFALFKWFADRL